MRLIQDETGQTVHVSEAGARVLLSRGGYTDPSARTQKPQQSDKRPVKPAAKPEE